MPETWITVACTPQLNRLHRRDEVRWEVTGPELRMTFESHTEAIARAWEEAEKTGLPVRHIDAMGIERRMKPKGGA